MKGKKLIAVAAATLMAATAVGALAGCGDDPHTITIHLLADDREDGFYQKYFTKMEETLLEETGEKYTIKYSGQQEEGYYDKLGSEISSNNIPDIFYVRPNELLKYKNRIQPLNSYIKKLENTIVDEDAGTTLMDYYDVDLSDVYPEALDMYRFNPSTKALGNHNDPLYAFPKDLSTQQLGYNKKLVTAYKHVFVELGLKYPFQIEGDDHGYMNFEVENYTWNQYAAICNAIAADYKKNGKPDGFENLNGDISASDMPNIEILARSFGGGDAGALLDLTNGRTKGKVNSMAEGTPIYKAIEYQANLATNGGADYRNATFDAFTAGKVVFYGEVGSWQISQYDDQLGEGNWGVMPWPTVTGSVTEESWEGRITSAGYVVSKKCKGTKADVAMRIAISFLSRKTQEDMMKGGVSLPLLASYKSSYISSSNDNLYSPSTRKYFIDVISGDHGFFPAKYSTYDTVWLDEFTGTLGLMYLAGTSAGPSGYTSPLDYFTKTNWTNVRKNMQDFYDETKDN